jgi:serine protease Do
MTAPNSGPPPPTGVERAAALIRPAIVEIQARYSGYVIDEDGVVLNNLFNGGAPYEVAWSCTGFGVNAAGFVATAGHCVDTTGPAASARTAMLRVVAEQIHEYAPHLAVSDIVSVGLGNWSVEGAVKGSPVDSQIHVISGATSDGSSQGAARPARVVDLRPFLEGDVALLKVESTDLPSAELAPDAAVQIGAPVVSSDTPAVAT